MGINYQPQLVLAGFLPSTGITICFFGIPKRTKIPSKKAWYVERCQRPTSLDAEVTTWSNTRSFFRSKRTAWKGGLKRLRNQGLFHYINGSEICKGDQVWYVKWVAGTCWKDLLSFWMFLIIICHEVWMDGIFTPDFWRGDWGEGWMLRGSGFDDVIVFFLQKNVMRM